MTYYHWLGADAEKYHRKHDAEQVRAIMRSLRDKLEDDGFTTIYPRL